MASVLFLWVQAHADGMNERREGLAMARESLIHHQAMFSTHVKTKFSRQLQITGLKLDALKFL
jgi:hypothetical protein